MLTVNRYQFAAALGAVGLFLSACGGESAGTTEPLTNRFSASCPNVNFGPAPKEITVASANPATMQVLGGGTVTSRYTAEVTVRGNTAYTTTWGTRTAAGNAIYVWDVSADVPVLADTVLVDGGVSTLGDVAVSPDGSLLVVATERTPGSVVIYDPVSYTHLTL